MAERLFFFQVDGDTRKVAVPYLDSVSDLIPLLTSKYTDKDISQDPEFWTKDKKFGVRFQISTPDDIYNGAVLEVVTREGKPSESNFEESNRSSVGGPNRYNPYPQGPGGYQASGPGGYHAGGPGGYDDGPGGFHGDGPFQGGPDQNGFGGMGNNFQEPQRADVQECATHKKQRTIQNLTLAEDGTWTCNPNSQCKTETSAGSGGEEVCSVHGKSRTMPNLQQGRDGKWTCMEGSRCKVSNPMGGGPGGRMRGGYGGGYGQFPGSNGYGGFGPPRGFRGGFRRGRGRGRGRGPSYGRGGYGGGYGPRLGGFGGGNFRGGRGGGGRGGGGLLCTVHNKSRTQANLRSDGCGGWVCLPTSQCK